MHFTLRAAAALLIGACAPAALVAPAFAQNCACATAAPAGRATGGGYVIQADEAPPPLPEYDQPPIPAPGYLWTPGYWAWNNVDYYWVPGVWVEPPQPGCCGLPAIGGLSAASMPSEPAIGGRTSDSTAASTTASAIPAAAMKADAGRASNFFYNTAVNSVRSTQVTNVYNSPVVVNNVTTINRVSFNGGKGGIVAAPTPQETLAASEPRVPPTEASAEPDPRRQH